MIVAEKMSKLEFSRNIISTRRRGNRPPGFEMDAVSQKVDAAVAHQHGNTAAVIAPGGLKP